MSVQGVDELLARLARGKVIGEHAATETRDALAEDVRDLAQSFAPVDTGRLQGSINAEGGTVATDVEYAAFVEYGTSDTPAQPFMRPAADTVDHSHAEEVGTNVLRGI